MDTGEAQIGRRLWPTRHPIDAPRELTPAQAWRELLAGRISPAVFRRVLSVWSKP